MVTHGPVQLRPRGKRYPYWSLSLKTAATKVKADLIRVSEVAQLMVIIKQKPEAYVELVKMLQRAKQKVDAMREEG